MQDSVRTATGDHVKTSRFQRVATVQPVAKEFAQMQKVALVYSASEQYLLLVRNELMQ
jgi:hypothetical protein